MQLDRLESVAIEGEIDSGGWMHIASHVASRMPPDTFEPCVPTSADRPPSGPRRHGLLWIAPPPTGNRAARGRQCRAAEKGRPPGGHPRALKQPVNRCVHLGKFSHTDFTYPEVQRRERLSAGKASRVAAGQQIRQSGQIKG
jgi:hypothetical protein